MVFFNKLPYLFRVQYLNISCRRFLTIFQKKVVNDFNNTWKGKFSNILIEPNNVSKETWESIRNVMIQCNNNNENSVDILIFQLFYEMKCLDAGINYYKFLNDNNYNLSIFILSEYLSFYKLKETLTDAEKIHISDICKKIMDHCKFLPTFAAETVVTSLCQIDEWEKAIMVIKKFESHDSAILRNAYRSLINYLLKNNSTLAYEYLVTAMQKNIHLSSSIYSTYLKYCLQERDTFNEKIEKLFSLWRKYGFKPCKDTIEQYIKVCNEAGWSAQLTNISKSQCNICHETLEETKLSEEEFERLREVIVKNVITDNAYRTSDPTELKRFTEFIMNRKPYDFVIDGLNLAASVVYSKAQIRTFLVNLKNDRKKVLVIGKKHFMNLIKHIGVADVADFFIVNDLSNDDAFVLYATFSSGNGTNIISMDLMRQHKFTFNSVELEVLFKRWQIMHQYTIDKYSDILMKLHEVMSIDSYVLKNNNCWHIPYIAQSSKQKIRARNINWACFNMCT